MTDELRRQIGEASRQSGKSARLRRPSFVRILTFLLKNKVHYLITDSAVLQYL